MERKQPIVSSDFINERLLGKWTDGFYTFRFVENTAHVGTNGQPPSPIDKYVVFVDDENPIIKFGGEMYTILKLTEDMLKLRNRGGTMELFRSL